MNTEQIEEGDYISLFKLLNDYAKKNNLTLKESASNLYGLANRYNFPTYTHFRLSRKLFPEIVTRNWMRFELNRDLSHVIKNNDFRYLDKEKLYRTYNYNSCGFHAQKIWDFLKNNDDRLSIIESGPVVDWEVDFEKSEEDSIKNIIENTGLDSQIGELNRTPVDPTLIPLHYTDLMRLVFEVQRKYYQDKDSIPKKDYVVKTLLDEYPSMSLKTAESIERIACPINRDPKAKK